MGILIFTILSFSLPFSFGKAPIFKPLIKCQKQFDKNNSVEIYLSDYTRAKVLLNYMGVKYRCHTSILGFKEEPKAVVSVESEFLLAGLGNCQPKLNLKLQKGLVEQPTLAIIRLSKKKAQFRLFYGYPKVACQRLETTKKKLVKVKDFMKEGYFPEKSGSAIRKQLKSLKRFFK